MSDSYKEKLRGLGEYAGVDQYEGILHATNKSGQELSMRVALNHNSPLGPTSGTVDTVKLFEQSGCSNVKVLYDGKVIYP